MSEPKPDTDQFTCNVCEHLRARIAELEREADCLRTLNQVGRDRIAELEAKRVPQRHAG